MLKYKYYPSYLILLSIAAPQCLISQLRQARERLAKQDARARTRSSSGAFACECAEQLTESRKLCTAARRCRGYRGIPPVLLFFCRRFLFQIKRKCRNAGSIYLLIIVRSECDTILNHTGLYEYKRGKMLMHLKFCFEAIPTEPMPGTMLRYYRVHKGLTTRQLAESAGIVPATVLKYESNQFPIPYQNAVAFADILEIDRNLLFDDFARFMDFPYSDRLREVRKAYRLNQTDFAEKANICNSIYAKWETAIRQPSRKMYEQLVTAYPEIKI